MNMNMNIKMMATNIANLTDINVHLVGIMSEWKVHIDVQMCENYHLISMHVYYTILLVPYCNSTKSTTHEHGGLMTNIYHAFS